MRKVESLARHDQNTHHFDFCDQNGDFGDDLHPNYSIDAQNEISGGEEMKNDPPDPDGQSIFKHPGVPMELNAAGTNSEHTADTI